MSEIISISVDREDIEYIKDRKLSPSKIFRKAVFDIKCCDGAGINYPERLQKMLGFQKRLLDYLEGIGKLEEFAKCGENQTTTQ